MRHRPTGRTVAGMNRDSTVQLTVGLRTTGELAPPADAVVAAVATRLLEGHVVREGGWAAVMFCSAEPATEARGGPGRFLLFGGPAHYPLGGAADLLGRFSSPAEATSAVHLLAGTDWAHVYDLDAAAVITRRDDTSPTGWTTQA